VHIGPPAVHLDRPVQDKNIAGGVVGHIAEGWRDDLALVSVVSTIVSIVVVGGHYLFW
jgi:hypothetical protein